MLPSLNFLKEKNLSDITHAQKEATEVVFRKKNIPFRSFEIIRRLLGVAQLPLTRNEDFKIDLLDFALDTLR